MVDDIQERVTVQLPKKYISSKSAQTVCFALILIMNLSAWIDLHGLYMELPIITPLSPERWTLPSAVGLCVCAANVGPVFLVLLRWRQGNRFSEIPYIYLVIIIGIVSCCLMGVFWQKTGFLFGRERSVWLLGTIFTLALLDCTSSLVFFDYMKRFRAHYLTAAFFGEGLTGLLASLLALAQGVGSEPICTPSINGTILKPIYSQPRFSVTVFLLLIAGIIVVSLIAFLCLRWTNIVSLANAAEPDPLKNMRLSIDVEPHEITPMASNIRQLTSEPISQMTYKSLVFLLILNSLNGTILFGFLPPVTTYSLLPYGQKAFYYASLLRSLALPISCVLSLRWATISNLMAIVLFVIGSCLSFFIICIAWQSPCPWMADTIPGAVIMVSVWFLSNLFLAYVRVTIGNRIKMEWSNEKGMFYFGTSVQLAVLLGTIPMYGLINIFGVFVERKPCHTYCLT